MTIFRMQLADGETKLKTDLKAQNEESARKAAAKWFDGARWRVLDIRRLAD
jgi:hypothetical protein